MNEHEKDRDPRSRDDTVVDERGVTLSRKAIKRAGQRIAESRARHDAAYFARLRARLGIPPGPA